MNWSELVMQWQASWNRRELRERRIYVALAFVVLLSLIFLVGVDPAMKKIKDLQSNLPVMKQQAALMTHLTEQYGQFSQSLSESIPAVTREAVESSLARRNIKTQSLTVSGEVVRFQVNAVAYANLMEWVLEMQKAARLTVDEAKVTALSDAGQVSVVLTLRQQKAGNS